MNSIESFNYIKSIFDKKEPHLFLRLGLTEARYMEHWLEPRDSNFLNNLFNPTEKHWLECTGFFPVEKKAVEMFLNYYSNIITNAVKENKKVTYIPTLSSDKLLNIFNNCNIIELGTNPFYNSPNFQTLLKNKKICIVSCFPKTFTNQCDKLEYLFSDKRLSNLDISNITFIKSPPHKFICSEKENPHPSWLNALNQMIDDITYTDYDILLTSCGAFSLPLCYHAFKSNKIAMNLGGDMQLLFGVKGKRWNNPFYQYNEYWINPLPEETPQGVLKVEGGCYW